MEAWVESAFERACTKFARGAKLAASQGIIPYKSEGGKYVASPFDGNSWWTGGFWPAIMWQLYKATGETVYMTEALRVEKLLTDEFRRFDLLNHDVGFMYLLSCGAHHRLTGDAQALTDTLHAATILAGRFNPEGFIRAWPNPDRAGYAIIDCMMNLSLLYWATEQTGDPRFAKIARIHADTTIREFLREDGSSCHICIFDPENGKVLSRPAGQGYCEGSSWSRGQAWALYGFTLSAINTGEERYLNVARKCAKYFISHIREDGLTDSDFCQPAGEERIDNIAGACAACGLLELAGLTGGEEGDTYRAAAMKLLRALNDLCADWSEDAPGILQKCTASYHDDGAGRHVNILYGDYFFVEALCKLRGTDAKLWWAKE
ncbi:MAG: glycoside hydrolase family 88 protein [Clostridiales bacterium]|nr:glycoside hydrolase family 88 protein [Clostridiales bacterium]